MTRYLADSSIWAWAHGDQRPDIREKLASRFEAGELVACVPVVLEVMHRARSGAAYDEIHAGLFGPLEVLPLSAGSGERAALVQRELAHGPHGNHLRPAVDYLIAAIAEEADPGVTLWFFDRDLRVICEHTGQSFEAEESSGPGR